MAARCPACTEQSEHGVLVGIVGTWSYLPVELFLDSRQHGGDAAGRRQRVDRVTAEANRRADRLCRTHAETLAELSWRFASAAATIFTASCEDRLDDAAIQSRLRQHFHRNNLELPSAQLAAIRSAASRRAVLEIARELAETHVQLARAQFLLENRSRSVLAPFFLVEGVTA